MLNLIKKQNDTEKIYIYAKDLSEPKYEFWIKKHEDAGTKHFSDPNAFTECSNIMDNVYENMDDYNKNRQRKILIVFDDIIAYIMPNKKFQAIIKELFIRCIRLNILSLSLIFLFQNSTHYLIMKTNNRKKLQNIAINHYADIDYNNLVRIYRECTRKTYFFFFLFFFDNRYYVASK